MEDQGSRKSAIGLGVASTGVQRYTFCCSPPKRQAGQSRRTGLLRVHVHPTDAQRTVIQDWHDHFLLCHAGLHVLWS